MTLIEREIDERGWGSVLSEIASIAQRELETRPNITSAPGCLIELVGSLKDSASAGREVDQLKKGS